MEKEEGKRKKDRVVSKIPAQTKKRCGPVQGTGRPIKRRKKENMDTMSCPTCSGSYNDIDVSHTWVCCEGCERWWHLECLSFTLNELSDEYYCNECLQTYCFSL